MRCFRFILLLQLFATVLFSQTIDAYIHPEGKTNKLTYFTPSKAGGKSALSYTTWFSEFRGDNFYMVETTFMKDKPIKITTSKIKCDGNKALLLQTVSTTMFETNVKRVYSTPKVFLILPNDKMVESWSETDNSGDLWHFSSERVELEIGGEFLTAIKVTKKHSEIDTKMFQYYVDGIGLWNVKFSDLSDYMILETQEIDPEAVNYDDY